MTCSICILSFSEYAFPLKKKNPEKCMHVSEHLTYRVDSLLKCICVPCLLSCLHSLISCLNYGWVYWSIQGLVSKQPQEHSRCLVSNGFIGRYSNGPTRWAATWAFKATWRPIPRKNSKSALSVRKCGPVWMDEWVHATPTLPPNHP